MSEEYKVKISNHTIEEERGICNLCHGSVVQEMTGFVFGKPYCKNCGAKPISQNPMIIAMKKGKN